MEEELFEIQRCYPQLYHACHVDHVRQASTPFHLSAVQAAVLAHLDPERGTSARDLARHMGVGAPSMSATLARLERQGCILRRPRARDRRVVEVRLSPRGREAIQAGSVLDTQRLRRLLGRLSSTERRRAVAGMRLLARAARELQRIEEPE
jgi:DNA-binding MarR family transcriptional regulator